VPAQTRPESSGTGLFITEDECLITNEHLVRDARQIRLVTSESFISANVVKDDAANDLELRKMKGRFAALPVAACRTVKYRIRGADQSEVLAPKVSGPKTACECPKMR
jgi:S1-C subfamily serine protease